MTDRQTKSELTRHQFLVISGYGLASALLVACGSIAGQPTLTPVLSGPETSAGWEKYPGNPVLGGGLGTCFDVSVLREGNIYLMWFSWRPKLSIALVESQDGIHWSQPLVVLEPVPGSSWETNVNRPVVLKLSDGYHMWYTGQVTDRSCIGYATSPDGVTWQRVGNEPVLVPEMKWEGAATMCPHVIFDENLNQYRMWYSAGENYEPNAIGYATSSDGISWQKYSENPIFQHGTLEWEMDRVTAAQVIPVGDWYYMAYIGFQNVHVAQIGLARSRDGIHDWQRHKENPIIHRGLQGNWDADAAYKPFMIYDGQRWLLWYNGRNGSLEQIGLAFHDGEDFVF